MRDQWPDNAGTAESSGRSIPWIRPGPSDPVRSGGVWSGHSLALSGPVRAESESSGRIAVASVASVAPGPPPMTRRYARYLARRALWRDCGHDRRLYRKRMREWLDANPRPGLL